jgi:hypothetical protein
MNSVGRHLVAGLLLGLSSFSAMAGLPIDSSYFPGPNLDLQARWLMPTARGGSDPALANVYVAESAFTELHLTIPPTFLGKRVRIFLIVPGQVSGVEGSSGFDVAWRTQGVFLPGAARPGVRVLFFQGIIQSSPLRDLVAYTFKVDARNSLGPIRFEPVYEIEEY